MIQPDHPLGIKRQAELLSIARGSAYYVPRGVSAADQALMRRIDALHLEHPFAGARLLRDLLRGRKIERANEVWAMEITYVPMARGWVYLAAVVDWASRRVLAHRVSISMDGRGAWRDNVFVERLSRTIKYEEVYLRAYDSVSDARQRLARYIDFYNARRPHSALGAKTPDEFYFATLPAIEQAA